LAPGESVTFTYKHNSIWSKYVKVLGHSYHKVQSNHQYFLSSF
jgi:hypothetical protein